MKPSIAECLADQLRHMLAFLGEGLRTGPQDRATDLSTEQPCKITGTCYLSSCTKDGSLLNLPQPSQKLLSDQSRTTAGLSLLERILNTTWKEKKNFTILSSGIIDLRKMKISSVTPKHREGSVRNSLFHQTLLF